MGKLRLRGCLGKCRAGLGTSGRLDGEGCIFERGLCALGAEGEIGVPAVGIRPGGVRALESWPPRRWGYARGGPGGFLLPFRLLGSGASWGEITSSPACPPPSASSPYGPVWPAQGWGGARGGDLALEVPAASLAYKGPVGISVSPGLGPGAQPGSSSACGCAASAEGRREAAEDLDRRCPQVSLPPSLSLSPPGASLWPRPMSPHPCAMAGWGSWGWDLLPITNHIARDFQPTLSSGAEDAACPGDRAAERPPSPCAWPEEQGLAACEQGPRQIMFTVAKFRPPGPHLLGPCRLVPAATACPAVLLPGLPGLCLPCLLS
nr:uncharacterized protein LOC105885479 [Microcebus murinus]